MIASMDLNASPQPEEDEETIELHYEDDSAPEHNVRHVEHIESAVEISRRVLHLSFDVIYAVRLKIALLIRTYS